MNDVDQADAAALLVAEQAPRLLKEFQQLLRSGKTPDKISVLHFGSQSMATANTYCFCLEKGMSVEDVCSHVV